MTAWFLIACFISVSVCGVLLLKHRLNALRSYIFATNVVFLGLYYMPVALLGLTMSTESQLMVVLGQVAMNLGLLLGRVLYELATLRRTPARRAGGGKIGLPDDGYLLVSFVVGVLGYMVLYAVRGIPVLADNVSIARAEFMTGIGFVVWPSTILINCAVWGLALKKRYALAIASGFVAMVCFLLTGWRGQTMIMVVALLFALSYMKAVRKGMVLCAAAVFFCFGVFGIVRSARSGYSGLGLASVIETTPKMVAPAGFLSIAYRLQGHAVAFDQGVLYFENNYLYGRGLLMDLSFLLPGKNFTVGDLLKEKFGDWVGGGGLPPTMLGGFYADFGWVGVGVLSFLVGAVQTLAVSTLIGFSSKNGFFLLYAGSLGAYWVKALLGTYPKGFVPGAITYGVGLFAIFSAYEGLRVIAAHRRRSAERLPRFQIGEGEPEREA